MRYNRKKYCLQLELVNTKHSSFLVWFSHLFHKLIACVCLRLHTPSSLQLLAVSHSIHSNYKLFLSFGIIFAGTFGENQNIFCFGHKFDGWIATWVQCHTVMISAKGFFKWPMKTQGSWTLPRRSTWIRCLKSYG